MADAIVYDPHCMNMSVEELGKAFAPLDYPQKDFDFQLMIAIGEYANSRGVAFPGMGTLAARLHCFKMDVKRGVDRLVELGFLAVEKVKKKGAKWEHNVYTLAKRFLRKTVDKLASHFDAAKWKTWVEEKMSERQRRKLVNRLCEQVDLDLEHAGVRDGMWMAMRYAKKHVGETPDEYDQILAEAIARYRDYDGPYLREIADRPVKPVMPVSAPIMEKPMKPANGLAMKPVEPAMNSNVSEEPWLEDTVQGECVSEENMDRMFRVFDKHPELVDDPEKAAEMAGVSFPDMKVSKPVSKPVEETTAPIQPVQTMKQETSLETLPANPESVSAIGSTVQANLPANIQAENAPKFINGEVDARWRSQMMLHQVNPSMYPAW